ncbi:MAG: hypothetical protein VXW22_16715 [Pseudomonadota bacterium]|nr:hypothetical protein [Pseudomonadota bacterium]
MIQVPIMKTGFTPVPICAALSRRRTAKEDLMRIATCLTALALIGCAHADTPAPALDQDMLAPIDLSTPEATAYSMMRAMYQGDASMIDAIFLDGAQLRRVTGDGEIRPDGLQRWRSWVDTLEVGQAHEELFAVTSEQFGHLATVWAPFVISVDGARVGCGVNTLTLAQVDQNWHVVFAMDTGEPAETCGDFEDRYTAD